MDTSKLRKFATFARSSLNEQVRTRLKTVLAEKSLARRESPIAVKELEIKIKDFGEKRVVETVAYTWFNRFCALRYMDVNRYTRIGVLSPAEGQFQPEILAEAKMGHIDEELVPESNRKQVMRLLAGSDKSADPQGEAYRLLFVAVCNYYHSLMPFMFEKIADYTELLLPDDLLSGTSIPAYTREALLPINCSPEYTKESVEVIGWLYQFYISEEKDSVMARKAVVPTDDIPAVTQLFTPHWIVRYLIENSLGRLWMLNHPDSKLRERMPYYIVGERESDFLRVSKPEEIRVLDPACGSGHMLTYAYDLLYAIYDEQGYSPTEIPVLILQHNLAGLEICDRAAALAAFALCMKARASDSRYFRRGVQPNILALQNIRIENEELKDYVDTLGLGEIFNPQLHRLLKQFEEAKNFGSLIQPTLGEIEIDSVRALIENQKTKIEKSSNELFLRETHLSVLGVLKQAASLSRRYHVIVANPPYMGSIQLNGLLSQYVSDNFEEGRQDLYGAFILRNLEAALPEGYVAMITFQNWLSASSFTELREYLINHSSIASLVHNGRGVWGADFGSCAFVLRKVPEKAGVFYRLFDKISIVASNEELDARFRAKIASPTAIVEMGEFAKLPGSSIVYWASERVRRIFGDSNKLGEAVLFKAGLSTGNNPIFQRNWFEVENKRFAHPQTCESARSGKRWFPCNSGGDFRKWYGNDETVVDWESDGSRLKSYKGSAVRNETFYFIEGLTYNKISIGRFAARYRGAGYIFDDTGRCVFPCGEGTQLHAILAFLCSAVADHFLRMLTPTVSFTSKELEAVPWRDTCASAVCELCVEAIQLSRIDWNNFETSWEFSDSPLLRPAIKSPLLEVSWHNWAAQSTSALCRMQDLETENNRLFISAYGLESELQPEVPEEQITLARADGKKDMTAFLSYAVGCMMGRYSPDHPGLILANACDTLREFQEKVGKPLAELNFAPDEDGIIPVLEGEWFDDDIVARTRDFLRATFGEATLAENLRFIEASLGKDLRKYFLNDFYKDHLQTYKKRPIYWLFSSPKGTFNALIYMHRYRPDTVGRVLQYHRDFRDKLAHREEHLQMTAGSANASKAEKTKAVKEVANIKKQLKELEEYEKTLFEVAARKIEIDLDNGVKHNYPLFGSVLRKIPGLDAKDD
jgi:hypothetical protein